MQRCEHAFHLDFYPGPFWLGVTVLHMQESPITQQIFFLLENEVPNEASDSTVDIKVQIKGVLGENAVGKTTT